MSPRAKPGVSAAPVKGERCRRVEVPNYRIAKAALLENARIYINAESDPFRHNLNVALYQFVEAVEAELLELKLSASRIEELLRTSVAGRR
jgi:hypothetical protein